MLKIEELNLEISNWETFLMSTESLLESIMTELKEIEDQIEEYERLNSLTVNDII